MNVALSGQWELWPEFAVRSTGFPASGLDVFGPEDEEERLVAVARDPRFREALAWQNREVLARISRLESKSPSERRRRLDMVASYWQRYCAKNDTIGFFGPLAWGTFAERTALRAGTVDHERVVHFETWAMEALTDAPLPMAPFPEHALPPDTPGLDRLLQARAAITPDDVAAGLAALDTVFTEVTGREAVRGDGDSGGGRTIAYLDCLRDLSLTLGPEVLAALGESLPPVLAASRWWCGRVFDRGAALLGQIARDGPLAPQLGPLMGAGFGLWDQMGEEQADLRRRWAESDAFADHTPAWYASNHHSPDIQIAAASVDAIARGDFQLVLGDFHGGDIPVAQSLFGLRHPDPPALLRRIGAECGPGVHLSPPRRGVVDMTARAWPLYVPGDVVVCSGDEPAPEGTRRAALERLVIEGGRVRGEDLDVPLAEFLHLPIFVAALRSFDPFGEGHERVTVGKLVVRRARWMAPAGEEDLPRWAREHGVPRRVFARSPLERKPRYVDFESPALCRGLARFARGEPMDFTELLPGPEDCWLDGHTSELRITALERVFSA